MAEVRRRPNAYGDLTEAQWQDVVVELAETFGWRCFYVRSSTREITRKRTGEVKRVRNINDRGQGYPDVTMVRRRDRRLLFVECKRDLGPQGGTGGQHGRALKPEQEEWRADLLAAARKNDICADPAHAGFEVYVWRPADYDDVVRILE